MLHETFDKNQEKFLLRHLMSFRLG